MRRGAPPTTGTWLLALAVAASLTASLAAGLAACSDPKPAEPEAVEITQIVILFRGPKNAKATRTKEEALAYAQSLRSDLLAGRPMRDLVQYTGVVDRAGKPFNGGRFRLTRDSAILPAFRDAAFSTAVGEIGPGTIETDIGYVVFRREE